MIDHDQIRQALESDQALMQAAAEIYKNSMEQFCVCLEDAEKEAARYAAELSEYLYDELALYLESPQAWSEEKAEQILESGQSGEHIAALAYLVSRICAPDSKAIPKLIAENLDELYAFSEEDCGVVTALFSRTPMSGMFASVQEIPCLADEKIRRLAMLLGFAAYCSRLEQGSGAMVRLHPEVTLDAMLIWGFAFAELMCSAGSEEKDEGYAQAVSCVACANLSHFIWFDQWDVLQGCLKEICSSGDRFHQTLRYMTEKLDAVPGGHIAIPAVEASSDVEKQWRNVLEAPIEPTGERRVGLTDRDTEQIDE